MMLGMRILMLDKNTEEISIRKELREEKGLTQAQLAEKINRTKTVISKYESNTQSPTLETLIDLAVIFNVSLDYLAGISEKSAVSLEGLSDEQKKIIIMVLITSQK